MTEAVTKKKKVSMMKTAANPSSQTSPLSVDSVSQPQYKSFLGKLLPLLRELLLNPPKSNLARILSEPKPVHAPVVLSHDENVYNHYAAYCKSVGVEPRTIEQWDSLRDAQQPTKAKTTTEKTEHDSFLETFLSGDRKLTHKRRLSHFSVMMNVLVGVRDSASCDPKDSFKTKPIP